jgi:hypothetical protein
MSGGDVNVDPIDAIDMAIGKARAVVRLIGELEVKTLPTGMLSYSASAIDDYLDIAHANVQKLWKKARGSETKRPTR